MREILPNGTKTTDNQSVITDWLSVPLFLVFLCIAEDTGSKSNMVHMSQKIMQMSTKPALITKKDVRFGKLATTKKPIKEKIEPVMETDWMSLEEMPTHKQPENVLRSDWWTASAFIEMSVLLDGFVNH